VETIQALWMPFPRYRKLDFRQFWLHVWFWLHVNPLWTQ